MSKITNSPLVKYTKLSPNHSGQRNHKIDTITIHCLVGHCSLETIGRIFSPKTIQSSCNYAVDDDGNVGMYVEEKNRSWCTSSSLNDHRAVTIEVASDKTNPYKITDKAMEGLIRLCVDICKRNGIKNLLWKADKNLIGKIDVQNITVHRWFANKSCPGDYLYNKLGYIADQVNAMLNNEQKENVIKTFKPYNIKVNVASLNYRKGPGTNFAVNGIVKRNQVYGIVDEKTGVGASKWGKLKSGAGWLSLDHCQKL